MEVEYVACYEAIRQAIWLRNFTSKFHLVESISKPLVVYCDNFVVVSFSQINKNSKHSKHFDTKYMFVK